MERIGPGRISIGECGTDTARVAERGEKAWLEDSSSASTESGLIRLVVGSDLMAAVPVGSGGGMVGMEWGVSELMGREKRKLKLGAGQPPMFMMNMFQAERYCYA